MKQLRREQQSSDEYENDARFIESLCDDVVAMNRRAAELRQRAAVPATQALQSPQPQPVRNPARPMPDYAELERLLTLAVLEQLEAEQRGGTPAAVGCLIVGAGWFAGPCGASKRPAPFAACSR